MHNRVHITNKDLCISNEVGDKVNFKASIRFQFMFTEETILIIKYLSLKEGKSEVQTKRENK